MADRNHNNPPSMIDFAAETGEALRVWMLDHPVIEDMEAAKAGKLLVDRASDTLKEMETERDTKVRPLNEQVKSINNQYRQPREALQTVLGVLVERLDNFAKAEEEKRIQEAEDSRKKAEQALAAAEAARLAQETAAIDAAQGVIVDVAESAAALNEAERIAQASMRAAARAEKATNVKITGGFRRALSRRDTEVLSITDVHAALDAVGLTDGIRDAILTAARGYRKKFNELPDGIEANMERGL